MKIKIVAAVIAAIFVAGVIGCVLVLTSPAKDSVRIVSNGEVLCTLDLSTTEDRIIEIPCGEHHNTVEIKDHRIRVTDSDCPDKTCVNMGWLSSSAMPIVCLPHRLVIEYTDSAGGLDAVTR